MAWIISLHDEGRLVAAEREKEIVRSKANQERETIRSVPISRSIGRADGKVMETTCVHCQGKIEYQSEQAAQQSNCPHCQNIIFIPGVPSNQDRRGSRTLIKVLAVFGGLLVLVLLGIVLQQVSENAQSVRAEKTSSEFKTKSDQHRKSADLLGVCIEIFGNAKKAIPLLKGNELKNFLEELSTFVGEEYFDGDFDAEIARAQRFNGKILDIISKTSVDQPR